MLTLKQGFPEEDELVLCTVMKVQMHSVFCNLDEYNKQGVIHISEVSPGRIRNIRDFVREGKTIVCKVLRINLERGHIDLSLRRVSESQKREKANQMKQQQLSEKIVEHVAKAMKKDPQQVFDAVWSRVSAKYDSLFSCFEEVVKNENLLKELGIAADIAKPLLEAIQLRIKPQEVRISGKLSLKSYAPDGIEIIRQCLKAVEAAGGESLKMTYLGAGHYNIVITSTDYKTAEKILEKATKKAAEHMAKHRSEATFERESR